MRALRLIELLELLRSRRGIIKAESMARDLGVSVRTVYRDIAALQAAGAPVVGEAGVGYQFQQGFFLPPLTLTADEAEAIAFAMQMVRSWGDDDLATAGTRALAKIRHVASSNAKEKFSASRLFALASTGSPAAPENLSLFRKAIAQRQVVALCYRDGAERSTRRNIWPLGLMFLGTSWILLAWCEMRQDFRDFRLDRVASAKTTGRWFKPSRGKQLEDALKQRDCLPVLG